MCADTDDSSEVDQIRRSRLFYDNGFRWVNFHVTGIGNRLLCDLPGFKYDDFDRTGHVDAHKLNRHFQGLFGVWHDGQRKLLITTETEWLVVGTHCTVSPELYRRAAVDFPMILSSWPTKIGRSSYDSCRTLVEKSTGQFLAKKIYRFVCRDRRTKQTIPIPATVRCFLSDLVTAAGAIGDDETFPMFVPPKSIPTNAYTHKVTVRYADMDHLLHANQASYITFFNECAAAAASVGFYRQVRGDFAFYPVTALTIVYVGESFAGQQLDVASWQDADDALTLNFAVSRGGKTISFARMVVGEPSTITSRL